MLAVHCPELGRPALVWPGQLLRARTRPDGILVDFRCPCGGVGTWRTGRHAPAEGLIAHLAPAGVPVGAAPG